MTGRRLYEHFTDAAAESRGFVPSNSVLPSEVRPPVAWPYLPRRDRDIWNALARRLTPKPRRASR